MDLAEIFHEVMDMSNATTVFRELFAGVLAMGDWTIWVMFLIGGLLIYLGVRKGYEPVLLFPMGIGCILANIPGHFAVVPTGGGEPGFLTVLYKMGIANELFPVLIFIGIGAMCDFTPLLRKPYMMLFAAAAHLGIFAATLCAALVGFPDKFSADINLCFTVIFSDAGNQSVCNGYVTAQKFI